MDVAADDALYVMLARGLHDGVLVVGDIFHRRLGFVLQVSGDRPITETEAAPEAIEKKVKIQNPVVEPCADAVEQAIEMRDSIELMAVQNEIAFPIGRRVDDFAREHHAAETHVEKLFQKFVVIAGNVNDLRFLAAFAKQFLDEHVVTVLPVPFRAQLPAVNEITDEVKVAALAVT
jgi:hypothetical protein